MTKLIFAIIAVIAALNFSSASAQTTQVVQGTAMDSLPTAFVNTQAPQVDRPLKKVGDFCTFERFNDWNGSAANDWNGSVTGKLTLTVSGVSDKGHEITKTSENSSAVGHFTETLELNAVSWDGTLFSPDQGYYSFPLYVGKTYEVRSSYTTSDGKKGEVALTAKVAGEEKIGEIITLKITYEGRYKSTTADGRTGSGKVWMTRWYAPSIGCVAKSSYKDTDWGGSVYHKDTIRLVGYKAD